MKRRNILKAQKRVLKLKRRTNNIGEYRKEKNYICLIANRNYRITEEEIKSIKMDILTPKGLTVGKINKIFRIRILMEPNKILTQKGILVRMGGGKAKVKSKVLYLTKGKICIELIPKISVFNKTLVSKLITKFTSKYPYFSYKYLL